MKDTYTWKVVYEDGSYTTEFDSKRPDGRGFAEREGKKVVLLSLLLDDSEIYFVLIPDSAEPVFFRRRTIAFGSEVHATVHCIGWKQDNQEIYLFVSDSGNILLTTNLQAI